MKIFKRLIVLSFLILFSMGSWAETLKVGLYPYVPRVKQFKQVLDKKWATLNTGIRLDIITDESVWDGGYDKNPGTIDVYVFDGLFLNKYKNAKLLEPLKANEIDPSGNLADFLSFTINGVKNSGEETYSGIPMFGCTNILFYRKGSGLENATTFNQVHNVVKTCQYTGLVPGHTPHDGMMLDMSGKTTNATYYIAAQYAMNGQYPFPTPKEIDGNVIHRLKTLMMMSSYLNSTNADLESYQRGFWFGQGYGTSFVGFTESMSGIARGNGGKLPDNFDFKPLPLWNNGETTNPIFYADIIGVNPKGQAGDITNAKKLAALLGSTEVVEQSSAGEESSNNVPQYLLLARKSAYTALENKYPMYQKMLAMIDNPEIKLFTLSDNLFEWFNKNKGSIEKDIRSQFQCGCDQATYYLITTMTSSQICPVVCKDNGGWNGQWTNQSPYVPDGAKSVCGCNTCNISN